MFYKYLACRVTCLDNIAIVARLAYLRNLYMLYILYVSTFVSNLHFHRRKCWDMCQLSRHVPTGNMSLCMSTERVCIVQRHVSKYLSISYYIGVVSLMCEDTLHHNVCEYTCLRLVCSTCLVRGHVSRPGSCVLPPYLAARFSLLIPTQKLSAAAFTSHHIIAQLQPAECRQLQHEHCTRHTGYLNKKVWTIALHWTITILSFV